MFAPVPKGKPFPDRNGCRDEHLYYKKKLSGGLHVAVYISGVETVFKITIHFFNSTAL
jgi:hypothetical protein